MLKRMTRGLALILMASPLLIVACDGSDNKDDAAVTTLDGGVDTDGSRVDAVAVTDVSPTPADGGAVSDTSLPSDSVVADASVSPDVSVGADAPQGSDVAADAAAGDATSVED